MMRWALPAALAVAVLAVSSLPIPATAADVNVVLIAYTVSWHVASPSSAAKPTITVNPGDILRLQVHNHDATDHTFTLPHFGVDRTLAPGSPSAPTIIFVNITTTSADKGKWQFYCSIPGHTTGTDETRDGMVGWFQVGAPPAPAGFEVVLAIAALGIVAVAVRVFHRRK